MLGSRFFRILQRISPIETINPNGDITNCSLRQTYARNQQTMSSQSAASEISSYPSIETDSFGLGNLGKEFQTSSVSTRGRTKKRSKKKESDPAYYPIDDNLPSKGLPLATSAFLFQAAYKDFGQEGPASDEPRSGWLKP